MVSFFEHFLGGTLSHFLEEQDALDSFCIFIVQTSDQILLQGVLIYLVKNVIEGKSYVVGMLLCLLPLKCCCS